MNRLTQKDAQMTLEEAISHAYDCAKEMCSTSCGEQHKQLGDWLTELQQYRQIGTLEECREAREKIKVAEKSNIKTAIVDDVAGCRIVEIREAKGSAE